MKTINLTTKLTGMKRNTLRVLAAATLASAFLAAAAPAAQAQRIVVGFGGPRHFVPAPPVRFYGGPVYAYGYRHDRYFDRRDFYRHDFDHRGFERRDWR